MDPKSPSQILLLNFEAILTKWLEVVRTTLQSASEEQDPIIIDTVPIFLENLAESLRTDRTKELATSHNSVALEHGGERARLTNYTPAEVIQEYQILRTIIFDLLKSENALTDRVSTSIVLSFDAAINEAMTAYFLIHSRIREQFTATLTHDLRSPLTVIKMSAELLRRQLGEKEKNDNLIAKILENVSRLDFMIKSVLDSSQATLGQALSLKFESCDLRVISQSVIEDLRLISGDRIHLIGNSIEGFWNPDSLRRSIENLCSNALKYGSKDGAVTIELRSLLGRAIISIHNTGQPIPFEEQGTLFESFMRSEDAKNSKTTGWGLGLAYVRSIAEGHKGSIGVDSALETGTVFTIDIPLDSRIKTSTH